MASTQAQLDRAFAKYGPSVDAIAGRYVNPVTGQRLTGRALLAKLVKGESGNRGDAVSSAGARSFAQFTPGSRAAAISKYGVDPWAGPDQAVHAASLHLRGHINGSTGLEGYNPGGGKEYVGYILGQHVGHTAGGAGHTPSSSSVGGPQASVSGFSPGPVQSGSLAERLTAPQVSVSGPALPSFAAQAVMPAGYTPVPTGGAGAPSQPVEQPVAAGQSLPSMPSAKISRLSAAPAAGGGNVVLGPGVQGHGKLKAPLLSFLQAVSARSGRDVTVTTGTNHDKYVLGTARVSDHYAGNAADLGVSGDARQSRTVSDRGDKIAAHAIQIASGMSYPEALKLARKGGIHNFDVQGKRVQIIWKTETGGNHFNHVHVGVA